MKVFMFPGQGSQYKGMGAQLFGLFPDVIQQANEILGYSIQELCISDPYEQINLTQYTQVALFVVNHLHYLNHIQTDKIKPDYLIGHSLGEYNALLSADVIDFVTALKLVKQRGLLMGEAKNGAMAAVLQCPLDLIKQLLIDNNLTCIDIANYNSPLQIVISGLKEDILKAKTVFEQANVLFIPLKVSAAFHSKHMAPAAQDFSIFLRDFEFNDPKIPVISNVTAKPYEPHQLQETLSQQICSSVQWTNSINYLLSKQVTEFKEMGPGAVLTNILKSIREKGISYA